jgi:hypothetical protein
MILFGLMADMNRKYQFRTILNEISAKYDFIGHTADTSVETDLLTMLLNMHDYNHQNGTHRPLLKLKKCNLRSLLIMGISLTLFLICPQHLQRLREKISNPDLLLLPKVLKAHLENHFPSLVIFHGKTGRVKSLNVISLYQNRRTRTRTYILMFGQAKLPAFKALGQKFLNFAKVIVEQDADILGKIYPKYAQKIKLNNEVGMDWVRRNFASFPRKL